jgi:drug/metabolite transporter (DMT)-like permease
LPLIVNQGSKLLKTKVWHWHLMRGVVGVSAMYCYFWALGHMPLTEAFLVKLSSPFFMPFIGLLWLGERAGKYSVAAVLVGFTGVACILRPDDSTFTFIAMVALLGAFLAALAKVTIRRMSGSESSQTIVFYFAMIAALISAPGAALHWQPVAAPLWGWILLLGLVATLGQLALTHAYRIAPTGKVGVYAYSAVLYGALMGWLIWDEIPLWTTWLGAALIVAAGLLNLYKPAKR